jgi:TM2 domain-containing membrane protein YozV
MSASPIRIALTLPARKATARGDSWSWVAPLVTSLAATAVLFAGSRRSWTHLQALLAFWSVAMPCFAYAEWRRTRRTQIPLFAVLAAAHMVFYSVSVFWTNILTDSEAFTSTAVLLLANSGVFGLMIGMRLGASGIAPGRVRLPDVPADIHDWWLIRVITACQVVVPFLPVGKGGDFRQVLVIVISFIPVVAFLILWDAMLRGRATGIDKALVALFLASSVLAGLATGWLGGCIGNLVLAGIAYVRVRRRLPLLPIAALIAVMLFLQGGKPAFRERYWYGTENASAFTKAKFWIEMSAERLTTMRSQPGGEGLRESIEPLLTRSSVVKESATVYENTPSAVPFQHGATYGYLLVTLIPRFLWPCKPSVNDANRFYQLSYGVTQQQDLDHVAIGAGLIPEAYMNFGWVGVPVIMCLAGVILGVFERVFLARDAGAFASAVGLSYVLQLLSLNGQAAAYFGGMIQIVGLTILIFLPGLRFRKRSHRLRRLRSPHGGMA